MDIVQVGAKLLMEKLGIPGNPDQVAQALTQLLAGKDGQIDLAGLVGKLTSGGGLQQSVTSLLGGGGTAGGGFNPAQLLSLFGNDKLSTFANKLGVNQQAATDGLAAVLPQMLAKGGGAGGLLESAGGLGGLLGSAKKLF